MRAISTASPRGACLARATVVGFHLIVSAGGASAMYAPVIAANSAARRVVIAEKTP
jgi:hypothetical protein